MRDTTRSTFVSWPIVLDQNNTLQVFSRSRVDDLENMICVFEKQFFMLNSFYSLFKNRKFFGTSSHALSIAWLGSNFPSSNPQNKSLPGFYQSVSYCDVSQSSGAASSGRYMPSIIREQIWAVLNSQLLLNVSSMNRYMQKTRRCVRVHDSLGTRACSDMNGSTNAFRIPPLFYRPPPLSAHWSPALNGLWVAGLVCSCVPMHTCMYIHMYWPKVA